MTKELIERLEKATGPDRELDAAIGAALRIVDGYDIDSFVVPSFLVGDDRGRIRIYAGKIDESVAHYKGSREARQFTGSLDAALTLVPDGLRKDIRLLGGNYACITAFKKYDGEGANYAIALCITVLRALSHTAEQSEAT